MKTTLLLRTAVLLTGALTEITNAAQPESYLCVTSQVTGFHFDATTKRWNSTNFNAETKYAISRATSDDSDSPVNKRWASMIGFTAPIDWVVRALGSKDLAAVCTAPDSQKTEDILATAMGVMRCFGIISEFLVNLESMKFQHYLWGSYSLKLAPGDDTAVEIGQCTKL